MIDIEGRIRRLFGRLRAKASDFRSSDQAKKAASAFQDFKQSDRAKKAADAFNDLKASDPAKKAAGAFNDLRASDAGQKAEATLKDLRQRESVRKAEESARKFLHDLRAGSGTSGSAGTGLREPRCPLLAALRARCRPAAQQ